MFYKIKGSIVKFLGQIRFYPLGLIVIGHHGYKMKGPDWRSILDIIKPGDIILCAYHNYVSSFFIKGKYAHSGIYVGDNSVINIRNYGISKEDILTYLRTDDIVVVRYKDKDKVPVAIDKAYKQLEKDVGYDYDFDRQDKEQFYCTEFTDYCYDYPLRGGVSKDKNFIYPDDYLISSTLFDIVWQK